MEMHQTMIQIMIPILRQAHLGAALQVEVHPQKVTQKMRKTLQFSTKTQR